MRRFGGAAVVSALALAGAAPGWAQDVTRDGRNFDFKLDGFFIGGVGYVDTDDDRDDVGVIRDAEVIVHFETVAENGLTFGAETQFEMGDEASAFVDENFLYIRGEFGAFEFGEQDGAKDAYHATGLVSGPFANAQDETGFLFDYYQDDTGVALTGYGDDTGDALKINFFTPSIAGLSAGLSYVPEPGAEKGNAVSRSGQTNALELGVGYESEIGGIAFAIGGGWASDTDPAADGDESWGGGARIGHGGLALGLQYGFEELAGDEQSVGGGVSYTAGPWSVGADFATVVDGEETEGDYGVSFGYSYSVAPGVDVGGTVEYAHDEDDGAGGARESLAVGLMSAFSF